MGVQDEIFKDFFSKLESAKLPVAVVVKLKKLYESNELDAMDKILEIFKEEVKDATNKIN